MTSCSAPPGGAAAGSLTIPATSRRQPRVAPVVAAIAAEPGMKWRPDDTTFGKVPALSGKSVRKPHIAHRLATQPMAPYFMSQIIMVQEHALNEAQARSERLEAELAQCSTGGELFGAGGAPTPRSAAPAWRLFPHSVLPAAPQGGGFLAGAAQTAMGVSGGMLLANATGGMLGGDAGSAAEPIEEHPFARGFDVGGMDEEL